MRIFVIPDPDPESTQGFFEDLLLLWIPELNSGQALKQVQDDIIQQTLLSHSSPIGLSWGVLEGDG